MINLKKQIFILFFSLIIIFVGSSYSQQQLKSYSLDEAIKISIENNRNIKVAKYNVEKAQAAVSQAFGYALPKLDFTANYYHFLKKAKMPFPDFEALLTNASYAILFKEKLIPEDYSKFLPMEYSLQSFSLANNFEAKAEVTQILFNSAVFRGIGASQIYLNLSKEQLKSTIASTVLDVQKAFYGVVLTKELFTILDASYNNAVENLNNVKALYKQGFASEYDAMQVEVQVENIKPKLIELKSVLDNAKNGLKILMAVDQSQNFDVKGELLYSLEPLPDLDGLIKKSLSGNFDIQTLEIKRQVDEAFIDLDLSEYWPALTAFANYSLAGASDDFKFQTYQSSVVGLNLSINLFTGMQTKNKVEQSTITVRQTEEQLAQLKDYIISQIKAKYDQINRINEQINSQERNVLLAEKAYKIATTRYKEKTGTQLEVKNADIELKTARTNKLQSVYDYITAKAELFNLVGIIDESYIKIKE